MSKINGGFQTYALRRRGLRPRTRMVLDSMAAEGRAGREKGHRWAEALSSVKVLKVNGVSVKLTRCFPPPPSSQTRWLRNRVFMAPTALSLISLMKDVRAVIPTCCGGPSCLPVWTYWLHTVHCNVSKCPRHEISLQSPLWLMPFHDSCLWCLVCSPSAERASR